MSLFAYVSLFNSVSAYDDEGYNVALIRLVSEGVPLYTGQFAYHGPLPYLVKAGILNALKIPVTHESVRLWVLFVWLLSALIGAAAIRNLTGNSLFAACSLVVLGVQLFPLRFNPGHPEDFVVLLLLASVFIASVEAPWFTENLRIAAQGLIGAALIGTKINVGILFMLGLLMWMLSSISRRGAWRVSAAVFFTGFVATPAVLMHGALRPEWELLLVSTVIMFLTAGVAFLRPLPPRYSWAQLMICIGSTAIGIVAILAATILHGSRPWDVLEGTILTAAKHPHVFLRPMSFGIFALPVLAAFTWISIRELIRIIAGPEETESRAPQSVLKVALPLCALLFAAFFDARYYLPFIGPVAWLVVFPESRVVSARMRCARLFLALAAVSQVLQIFPIVGTQTAWSALLLCVCALVLLHDGVVELSAAPRRMSKFASLAAVGAGGLAVYSLVFFTLGLWTTYRRGPVSVSQTRT